ncbi:hypothetical protein [Neptuniibacter sp. QD37_11]|uniref:hypothetical protein n=1 Tax=Neptuniibacter sp. QD37_11 TaxID=3398209 RepID=UPI0039F48DA8
MSNQHPDNGPDCLSVQSDSRFPPCAICGGPNDMGEVCASCAKNNDPFVTPDNYSNELKYEHFD